MSEDMFEERLRRDLDAIAENIPVSPPQATPLRIPHKSRVLLPRIAVGIVALAVAGTIGVVVTDNLLSGEADVATADQETNRSPDSGPASDLTWAGHDLDAGLPGDPAFAATEPGTVIVWGGRDSVTNSLSAQGVRYDLARGTSEPLPPAPLSPRADGLATAADGKFVVVGGSQGQGSADTREGLVDGAVYDQRTESWLALPPVSPTARWLDGVALHEGVIYVTGRDSDGSGKLWRLDTANQPASWEQVRTPVSAENLFIELVDDKSLLLEAENVQPTDVPGADDFPLTQRHLYQYRFADGGWEDLGEVPVSVESPDHEQEGLQVDPAAYFGDADNLALITYGGAVLQHDPASNDWHLASTAPVPAPCQDGTRLDAQYVVWGCGLEGAVSTNLTEWETLPPPDDGLIIHARSRDVSGQTHVLAFRPDGRGYVASLAVNDK